MLYICIVILRVKTRIFSADGAEKAAMRISTCGTKTVLGNSLCQLFKLLSPCLLKCRFGRRLVFGRGGNCHPRIAPARHISIFKFIFTSDVYYDII